MANKRIETLETEFHQFRTDHSRQMEEVMAAITNLTMAVARKQPLPSGSPVNTEKSIDDGSEFGHDDEHATVNLGKGNDLRLNKLKMPVFDGGDVYGWIYQAERYFDIQDIRPREQVRAAVLCLEGPALSWYRWSEVRSPFRTWEGFKRRLLDRFQSSGGGNLYEQLLDTQQEGTARDYVTEFERVAAQLPELQEPVLEGAFMRGLKPELRAALRILQPIGLPQSMKLAITVDENQYGGKGGLPGSTSFRPAQPYTALTRGGGPVPNRNVPAPKPPDRTAGRLGQFKRLTGAEMADKRAKGLCFRCDERFTPGHKCNSRTLQVLIMAEETDEETEISNEEEDEHAHIDNIEVSLNSVVGLTPPHTMKLRGEIGGISVVVLIDSGATHNFISPRVVEATGLQITQDRVRGVVLGNGKTEGSKGLCTNVLLIFSEFQVLDDFLLLELGSTDVILGIKWLSTLGETIVNWKELTMTFYQGDTHVRIQGEPGLCKSQVSAKAICRALQKESEGFFVEVSPQISSESVEDQSAGVA